jgi:hypothetical protein
MEEVSPNPILVPLMFILRCLVPLLVMLGISYLLKKLGFIAPPPPPPPDETDNGNNNQGGNGCLAHGKA